MSRRVPLFFLIVLLLCAQASAQPRGGFAYFTNDVYDCPGSTYSYIVSLGPPNTCGTLKLVRNGVYEETPGWLCTDASGNATKGPWTVSTNQTGQNIRIEWPNGTSTYGADTKVDDYSAPTVSVGSADLYSFAGTASDAQWGSGFGPWTTVRVTYMDAFNGLYWDGWCYCSASPAPFNASFSPVGGYNITWSSIPPPSYAHDPFHAYQWCAVTNDHCSDSNTQCVIANTSP
jgi:hypothetical protein